MAAQKAYLMLVFQVLNTLLLLRCLGAETSDRETAEDRAWDYRQISHQDVMTDSHIASYQVPGVLDFSQFIIDPERHQLIVGARNNLLRLDLKDLTQLERVTWSADKMTLAICKAKGQSEDQCHNFIRVLLVHKNRLFVCGTHAYKPLCQWRPVKRLDTVHESVDGVAKCPYDPNHNNTFYMAEDGSYFSGAVTDFTARDPAIFRQMGPNPRLRTHSDSKWLNNPDFVSSYEIGNYIYFFFRETATEYINCGKSVYSRVARICKSDSGGKYVLENKWTSFMKARLNCSLPGKFPFYFNYLQSTYYMPERGLLYAIFTTSPTSIYGSAVCVYNMTAFQRSFSGPFKYQANSHTAWTQVPNANPNFSCPSSNAAKRSLVPEQRALVDAQKYQLMDSAVQPSTLGPSLFVEGKRWTHIVVDHLETKHHETVDVVFIATLEGTIEKHTTLPGSNKSCLVEVIQVLPKGRPQPIKALKIHHEQKVLYVGTHETLHRLPLHRCQRFSTKSMCMNAQDPYCGWSSDSQRCASIPDSLPEHNWHQNLSTCPLLSYKVNGGWSDWSKWSICRQTGAKQQGTDCLCRVRICNNPSARFGGTPCYGSSVETTNCTSNGGWTEWSEWSSCSATCGTALRMRKRTCGNPEPRFGGRVCVGSDRGEQLCINPECPVPKPTPIDGNWSPWNGWTGCSAQCGGGIQNRTRRCNNPAPKHEGQECPGNNREWRTCNEERCKAVKVSNNTPWRVLNKTKDGYYEGRYKLNCKANLPDLETDSVRASLRHQVRFCSETDDSCGQSEPPIVDVDGEWSRWTPWTACDQPCGGGEQSRERVCSNPIPQGNGKECLGHALERRECNIHSCYGQWTCWSDFTTCSVTCGQGERLRNRVCMTQVEGRQHTQSCPGQPVEKQKCEMPACNTVRSVKSDSPGWGEWTGWSVCHQNQTQQRKRFCNLPFPYQCTGPDVETRMCYYNTIYSMKDAAKSSVLTTSSRQGGFEVYHLLIAAMVGFCVGAVLSVAMYHYCRKWKKWRNNSLAEKYTHAYNSLQRQKAESNLYMSPTEMPGFQHNLNNKFENEGTLSKKDYSKMTVKEATIKREATLKRNSSLRTNLSMPVEDY